MAEPKWEQQVLDRSKVDAIFLTNQFDDPLTGFDTQRYIPCLRTDDLVFHLGKPEVRQRLQKFTNTDVGNATSLRSAIGKLFQHFVAKDARACAISLPPTFAPRPCPAAAADTAIETLIGNPNADQQYKDAAANFAFWMLAEFCAEHKLPFDLMIGVNRAVYRAGVFQGQDL